MARPTALDRRRLGDARVARLATVAADGHPHVVPCTFALDGDLVLTAVDAKPKSTSALRRLDNIAANPAVSLLVDHYDDDWTQLWWLRIDGVAHVHHTGPRRQRALELLAAKYPQYAQQPAPGPVIAITIRRWVAWEHGSPAGR